MSEASYRKLLLIGSEATKAMSPLLWAPVLRELNTGWAYEALDVSAEAQMDTVRARLLDPSVVAANVTMPHKQWAARTADIQTVAVERSGAANFLIHSEDGLSAHNTDVDAFNALLPAGNIRRALIIGAGGAARASLVALHGRIELVTVADPNTRAAKELTEHATRLDIPAVSIPWDDRASVVPIANLIVNATPIGKGVADLPAWGPVEPAENTVIYDYVYADHVTASIWAAQKLTLHYIDGWAHLWAQAAAMVPLLNLPAQTPGLLQESLTRIQTS